eukprot:403360938
MIINSTTYDFSLEDGEFHSDYHVTMCGSMINRSTNQQIPAIFVNQKYQGNIIQYTMVLKKNDGSYNSDTSFMYCHQHPGYILADTGKPTGNFIVSVTNIEQLVVLSSYGMTVQRIYSRIQLGDPGYFTKNMDRLNDGRFVIGYKQISGNYGILLMDFSSNTFSYIRIKDGANYISLSDLAIVRASAIYAQATINLNNLGINRIVFMAINTTSLGIDKAFYHNTDAFVNGTRLFFYQSNIGNFFSCREIYSSNTPTIQIFQYTFKNPNTGFSTTSRNNIYKSNAFLYHKCKNMQFSNYSMFGVLMRYDDGSNQYDSLLYIDTTNLIYKYIKLYDSAKPQYTFTATFFLQRNEFETQMPVVITDSSNSNKKHMAILSIQDSIYNCFNFTNQDISITLSKDYAVTWVASLSVQYQTNLQDIYQVETGYQNSRLEIDQITTDINYCGQTTQTYFYIEKTTLTYSQSSNSVGMTAADNFTYYIGWGMVSWQMINYTMTFNNQACTDTIWTYSATFKNGSSLPSFITYGSLNNTLYVNTSSNAHVGTFIITLSWAQVLGPTYTYDITLNIKDNTSPPQFDTDLVAQTVNMYQSTSYTLPSISDVDGNTRQTTISTLPTFVTIDANKQVFTISPTLNSQAGTHSVTITLSDYSLNKTYTLSITVNPNTGAPYFQQNITDLDIQDFYVGDLSYYQLPDIIDDDSNTCQLDITNALPTFITFNSVDNKFTINPTMSGYIGNYTITLKLSDYNYSNEYTLGIQIIASIINTNNDTTNNTTNNTDNSNTNSTINETIPIENIQDNAISLNINQTTTINDSDSNNTAINNTQGDSNGFQDFSQNIVTINTPPFIDIIKFKLDPISIECNQQYRQIYFIPQDAQQDIISVQLTILKQNTLTKQYETYDENTNLITFDQSTNMLSINSQSYQNISTNKNLLIGLYKVQILLQELQTYELLSSEYSFILTISDVKVIDNQTIVNTTSISNNSSSSNQTSNTTTNQTNQGSSSQTQNQNSRDSTKTLTLKASIQKINSKGQVKVQFRSQLKTTYDWSIESISDQQYMDIQLTFNDSSLIGLQKVKEKVRIQFMDTKIFRIASQNTTYLQTSEIQAAQLLQSKSVETAVTTTAYVATFITISLQVLLGGTLSMLYQMVNAMQLIVLIPLNSFTMPDYLSQFFTSFNSFNFQLFDMTELILGSLSLPVSNRSFGSNFDDQGYSTSNILINNFDLFMFMAQSAVMAVLAKMALRYVQRLEKFATAWVIIYCRQFPVIQALLHSYIGILFTGYVLVVRPFKENKSNILEIINQISTTIIYMMTIALTDFVEDQNIKSNCCWAIIATFALMTFINIGFVIQDKYKNLKEAYRNRKKIYSDIKQKLNKLFCRKKIIQSDFQQNDSVVRLQPENDTTMITYANDKQFLWNQSNQFANQNDFSPPPHMFKQKYTLQSQFSQDSYQTVKSSPSPDQFNKHQPDKNQSPSAKFSSQTTAFTNFSYGQNIDLLDRKQQLFHHQMLKEEQVEDIEDSFQSSNREQNIEQNQINNLNSVINEVDFNQSQSLDNSQYNMLDVNEEREFDQFNTKTIKY